MKETLIIRDSYTNQRGELHLTRRSDGRQDYVASFGPNHEASHSGITADIYETAKREKFSFIN